MNKDILMRFFDRFAIITTVIFLFSGIFIAVFWGTSTEIHLSYVFAVLIISFVLSAILLFLPAQDHSFHNLNQCQEKKGSC